MSSHLERFREFLNTTKGRYLTTGLAAVLIGIAVWVVIGAFKSDTPDSARSTMYICTETGKPFRHENKIGEVQPILSPHSGKNTGVTAEGCYWSKEGTIKTEPTWVLLNQFAGKDGPTFCPDCGRLVVARNPVPQAGANPPPTKETYVDRPRRSRAKAGESASTPESADRDAR